MKVFINILCSLLITDRCLGKRGDGYFMKISYKAQMSSRRLDAFFKERNEEEE